MKTFIYTGKQAHNSTIRIEKDGKKTTADLRLAPGDEVTLQEDHPVIKALILAGHLVESIKQNLVQKNLK